MQGRSNVGASHEPTKSQNFFRSFLALVKQVHPDQNRSDPSAEKAFKKVSEAYEVLRCPTRRSAHLEGALRAKRREPPEALDAIDRLAQPWLLGLCVSLFFCAEILRILYGRNYDHHEPLPVVVSVPEHPRPPPLSPAFSANPGKPLVGPTLHEIGQKLQESRRRRGGQQQDPY